MTTRISGLRLKGNLILNRNDTPALVWNLPAGKILGIYHLGDTLNIPLKATGANLYEPITYSVLSGSLPDGISISSNNNLGLLSGVLAIGQGQPEITLRASSSGIHVDHDIQMVIGSYAGPTWITPEGILDLNDVLQPVPDIKLEAVDLFGVPLQYLLVGGQLPPGVVLNADTGQLSGIYPDLEEDMYYEFTVSASNGDNATSRDFSIYISAIAPEDASVWITPPGSIGEGYEIAYFSTTVHAIDPNDRQITYVRVAGNIPDGLHLNPNTGELSGNPDERPDDTTYKFILGARTDIHTSKRLFMITIKHDEEPVLTDPNGDPLPALLGSVIEGNPFSYQISVVSNPELPVVYTAADLPEFLTFDQDTGMLTATEAPLVPAPRQAAKLYEFEILASDTIKTVSTDTSVKVLIDYSPSYRIGGDSLGAGFGSTPFDTYDDSTDPMATDAHGRPVTYALSDETPLPEGLIFDPNTGRIYGTLPAAIEDTDIPVTMTATSGPLDPISTLPGANPNTKEFVINVWLNIEPVWDTPAGSIGIIIEETEATSLRVQAHDFHEEQTVTYRLTSSEPPVPGLTLNETTGFLEGFTQAINDPDQEIYNFTIEASYDGLLPTTRNFSVTVEKNKPPIWDTPGGQIISVLAGQTFSVEIQAHDPNGTEIVYELVDDTFPEGSTIQFDPDTHKFEGEFADNFIADTPYSATVSGSDDYNEPVERTFVLVSERNMAPEWITEANSVIIDALEGTDVSGFVQALDPENAPLTYYITTNSNEIINDPSGSVNLTSDGQIVGKFPTVEADREVTFTVTAWDNTYEEAFTRKYITPRQFRLMIRFDQPPVWQTSPTMGEVEQTPFTLTLVATGSGNHPSVTYSMIAGELPEGITFNPATAVLSGTTPASLADHSYSFTIRADNGTKHADRVFTFNVYKNIAPAWISNTDITPALGNSNYSRFVVADDVNLPFGNALVYAVTDRSAVPIEYSFSTNTISGVRVFGTPAISDTPQTYSFSATVSDGLAAPVPQTFNIHIIENQNPVWDTQTLASVLENKTYNISVHATDPEGNSVVYALANGTSLPPGLSLVPSTGLITGITPSVNADTDYEFSISADDGSPVPHLSYQNFTLTVENNVPPEWVTAMGNLGAVLGGYSFDVVLEATDANVDSVVTYTVTSGALPPGLDLDIAGAFRGSLDPTIQADQQYDFEVTASDGVNGVQRNFYIYAMVNLPPVFNPAGGLLGQHIEKSNVVITIDVVDPEGQVIAERKIESDAPDDTFTLDANGNILGALGPVLEDTTYTIDYMANDGIISATAHYTYLVKFDSPPVFTDNPTLPQGIEAQPYGPVQLTAVSNGEQIFYSLASGTLPSGLTLTTNGVVAGTCPLVDDPTDFQFTVRAATLTKSNTQQYTLRVIKNQPPVWTTNSVLEPSMVEQTTNLTYTLEAHDINGLPLIYTVQSGALPPMWVFNANAANGVATISGDAPATASDIEYDFTIGASNGYIRTDRNFVLPLLFNRAPVWVTNAGTVVDQFSGTVLTGVSLLATDPESKPITYQMNSITNAASVWLTLNPTTGALTGTLPIVFANTSYSFTTDATDGLKTSTRAFDIQNRFNSAYFDAFANYVVVHSRFDSSVADEVGGHTMNAITTSRSATFPTIDLGVAVSGASAVFSAISGTGNIINTQLEDGYNLLRTNAYTNGVTVEFWFRPATLAASGAGTIFHAQDYTLPSTNLNTVYIQQNTTGKIVVGSVGAATSSVGAFNMSSVRWYHIALVTGTSGTSTKPIEVFIDGVSQGTFNTGTASTSGATVMLLGGEVLAGQDWSGALDELRITAARRYSGNFTTNAPNPIAPKWNSPAVNAVVSSVTEGNAISAAMSVSPVDPHATSTMLYEIINGSVSTVTINPSTGLITGTMPPSGPTLYSYVHARDSNGNSSSYRRINYTSTVAAANGLVSSWRFNRDIGSTNFAPSYGTNYGMTTGVGGAASHATHAAAPAPHGTDTAMFLDNQYGYSADIGTSWSFMTNNDFTLEFWFYISNASGLPGNYTPLALTDPSINDGNNFRVFKFSGVGGDNNWYWSINSNSQGVMMVAPTVGQWNHVALVRQGNQRRSFMNGISSAIITGTTIPSFVSNSKMCINDFNTGSGFGGTNTYMKSIHVWNQARYWGTNFTPLWPGY